MMVRSIQKREIRPHPPRSTRKTSTNLYLRMRPSPRSVTRLPTRSLPPTRRTKAATRMRKVRAIAIMKVTSTMEATEMHRMMIQMRATKADTTKAATAMGRTVLQALLVLLMLGIPLAFYMLEWSPIPHPSGRNF